jgi:hypothetical protein
MGTASKHIQLDTKLSAVLARLVERRGALAKTQAAKLPYLVDVIAKHVLGRRITAASHENWQYGVVAAEVWHFAKPGERGIFKIEELPYSEGRVRITLVAQAASPLSADEREVVDFTADEFGSLDYDELGKLTKAMNFEAKSWGSNSPAKIDKEAYLRLIGRWDRVLAKLEHCGADEESNWQDVTGASLSALRNSLGVSVSRSREDEAADSRSPARNRQLG